MEGILGTEELGNSVDKCKTLAGQKRGWAILAVKPRQLRLVLEQFQLAWGARHMQINDATSLRGKLRWQGRERMAGIAREIQARLATSGEIRCACNRDRLSGHRAKKQRSQPSRASAQKMSTCVGLQEACMKVGRQRSGTGCHL